MNSWKTAAEYECVNDFIQLSDFVKDAGFKLSPAKDKLLKSELAPIIETGWHPLHPMTAAVKTTMRMTLLTR
ncbi:hypothetical protein EYF80_039903 [Liparis tanakae]|uniref:Uncharacterized protein n=1 Tax=Liparis tanakae TaxID=230148 RepID=A0A4Z2GAD8_9TELE|nr:hypothetical protein EYF80_039903 [Liparis tanakae]